MAPRSYLTTFEISRICQVNPTTVQNWIKEKKLRAFLTPGGHRRVLPKDLVAFMNQYGMPIPPDLREQSRLVLIVDDDQDALELLSTAMRTDAGNLRVIEARDGVEALLLIGEQKPDLVILDILMPGMNGFEVCRKLRSSPSTRSLKIVAITGDHSPETRLRILDAGADAFYTKPLDIVEFRRASLKLLES